MSQSGIINVSGTPTVPTTFTTDSGNAVPALNVINIDGATSSGGAATNINTKGAGNTVGVCLNNSISQPTTNATGTTGLYSLAGDRFMHNYSSGFGGFGAENTFLGRLSGNLSNSSTFSTGIGADSLTLLTSGTNDTGCGAQSLAVCSSGTANTAVGSSALRFLTTGSDNSAVGFDSLYNCISGIDNSAFGSGAGYNVTTNQTTCIGRLAGYHASTDNTFVGFQAGYNSAGIANTAIGSTAMFGSGGIFTGISNVCCGSGGIFSLISGSRNCCIGHAPLRVLTTGSSNIALGYESLFNLLTGDYNIAIGENAGNSYTTAESSNVVISNSGTVGESNAIRIGTQGAGNQQQNTCYIAGITGVTTANSQLVTINSTTGQLGAQTINYLYKKIPIDSAHIKNLTAAPYQLVAAAGANTVIVPVSCTIRFVYAGTNQFTGGSDLDIVYATSVIPAISTVATLALIDGATDAYFTNPAIAPKAYATGSVDNLDLILNNNTGTDFAGNAAGDNSLIVELYYYIATLT